jgi:hypothetical protein
MCVEMAAISTKQKRGTCPRLKKPIAAPGDKAAFEKDYLDFLAAGFAATAFGAAGLVAAGLGAAGLGAAAFLAALEEASSMALNQWSSA